MTGMFKQRRQIQAQQNQFLQDQGAQKRPQNPTGNTQTLCSRAKIETGG
jgi:hypothetical protein